MKKVLLLLFLAAPVSAAMYVCFSPDNDCSKPLVQLMGQAKQSLDIEIYDINMPSIVNTIIGKSAQIKVRVIVDKEQATTKTSLVPMMAKAGVSIRYGKQKGIMHDKVTIIDGQYIETGSYNYTNHATLDNHENQIYTNDPDVVVAYQMEFEKIWNLGEVVPPNLR